MSKFRFGLSALSLGIMLAAGVAEAQALPMGSRPSTPIVVEDAQTIVIIRRHRPWRAYRAYRPYRRAWASPYYLDAPRFALFPPDDYFLPPPERRRSMWGAPQQRNRRSLDSTTKSSSQSLSTKSSSQSLSKKSSSQSPKKKSSSQGLSAIRMKSDPDASKAESTTRKASGNGKVTGKNTQVAVARPESAPAPSRKVEQKHEAAASKSLSCNKAASVIAGYAFSEVKPVTCTGSNYKFMATREQQPYEVTVNAADGTLVKVTKANQP